jgi:hypothetical protein
MISGNPDVLLQVKTYQDSSEALQIMRDFLTAS